MKKGISILGILFFIGIWEYVSRTSFAVSVCFPAPSLIVQAAVEQFDRLLFHTKITAFEMVASVTCAFFLALTCVCLMVWFSAIATFIQTVFCDY